MELFKFLAAVFLGKWALSKQIEANNQVLDDPEVKKLLDRYNELEIKKKESAKKLKKIAKERRVLIKKLKKSQSKHPEWFLDDIDEGEYIKNNIETLPENEQLEAYSNYINKKYAYLSSVKQVSKEDSERLEFLCAKDPDETTDEDYDEMDKLYLKMGITDEMTKISNERQERLMKKYFPKD